MDRKDIILTDFVRFLKQSGYYTRFLERCRDDFHREKHVEALKDINNLIKEHQEDRILSSLYLWTKIDFEKYHICELSNDWKTICNLKEYCQ